MDAEHLEETLQQMKMSWSYNAAKDTTLEHIPLKQEKEIKQELQHKFEMKLELEQRIKMEMEMEQRMERGRGMSL
jgi:hypothetical protein